MSFSTAGQAIASRVRQETGREVLPAEVDALVREFVCAVCRSEGGMVMEVADGFVRVVDGETVACPVCGAQQVYKAPS